MEVLMLDLRLEMKDPKRRKRLGEFSPFCEDRAANDSKKAGTNLHPPNNQILNGFSISFRRSMVSEIAFPKLA